MIDINSTNQTHTSGKGTLSSALLRLLDLDSGTILIDNLDISTIPRNILRERLVTIPQDPFIINGSIRLNADPSGTLSDTSIMDSLKKVALWSTIQARGGLGAIFAAQPLSKGQEQVFYLARAILKYHGMRGSKILILDEATSDVDLKTDRLMQGLIGIFNRFQPMSNEDTDKISVMEEGEVVGFGRPEIVLNREFAD